MGSIPETGLITWLNHYSVIKCLDSEVPIEMFDYVGIDGVLLRLISRLGLEHSSADFSLPFWLGDKRLTVGLVGGTLESAEAHEINFSSCFPNTNVLWSLPGDKDYLKSVREEFARIGFVPQLVLVAMGAPVQENAAIEISKIIETHYPTSKALIATCGGWLDQLGVNNYYPKWATPLRLNWLVRLYREPARLWKRYLIYPIFALYKRKMILEYLKKISKFIG